MERQSDDAYSYSLGAAPQSAEPPAGESGDIFRPVPLPLLILLMLAPWLWVAVGLMAMRDYRWTILLYEGLGCALPATLLCLRPPAFRPLRMSPIRIVLGVLALNVGILSVFKWTAFGLDWVTFQAQAQQTRLMVDGWFWLFAGVIVFVNPVLEEVFWRGCIYREWRRRIGARKAALVSAFFFGAWHWLVLQHYCRSFWAWGLTLLVMLGGWMLANSYEKTNTLGAAVLLHGLGTDLSMVFVVYECLFNARLVGG